jgi:N-acetylmuramoyl-L-alanine amidase
LEQWSRANGLAAPLRLTGGTQASYAISTPRGVLAVKTGSRAARWDGLGLQLAYAPMQTNGQLCVHALDAQKNFQPLLAPTALPAKSGRVIVVDPGHGGLNAGAKSVLGERYEKEFALDWARRLAPLLATNGWTVLLTRTNDTDVSLSNRVAFAEAHHADLFLSLHFNSAGPNPEPNGLETYCLTPTGMPSTLTRDFEDDLSLVFPNNSFDEQNLQYAVRLHRALLAVNGDADRSVCHARFMGVLRGQRRPAVLLEGGYLSNPREAQHIADPAHRQKLAAAVARALQ